MNIRINRETFLPALTTAASVVERRQTLPILSNLLIRQEGDTIHLTGSDLEVEINQSVLAAENQQVEVTLSASKLLDICKVLPKNADIDIAVSGTSAVMKSGRSRFTLKTLPVEEYPSLQTVDFEERLDVNAADLLQIFHLTSFSMAVQDVRYYLNGVLLDFSGNRVVAVATDGHRLSKSEFELPTAVANDRQMIVPRKAVLEITRLLSAVAEAGDAKTVRLETNKKHLRVSALDTTLTCTLIDGQFPEYQSIINVDLNKDILMDRVALLESFQRMAVLTNDRLHGVRIELSDQLLKVTTNNPEQEEAEDEIPCDYSGEEVKTSFNVNYLIEALRIIPAEKVVLRLKDKDSVCVIANPNDDKSTWLVMPMRM